MTTTALRAPQRNDRAPLIIATVLIAIFLFVTTTLAVGYIAENRPFRRTGALPVPAAPAAPAAPVAPLASVITITTGISEHPHLRLMVERVEIWIVTDAEGDRSTCYILPTYIEQLRTCK